MFHFAANVNKYLDLYIYYEVKRRLFNLISKYNIHNEANNVFLYIFISYNLCFNYILFI